MTSNDEYITLHGTEQSIIGILQNYMSKDDAKKFLLNINEYRSILGTYRYYYIRTTSDLTGVAACVKSLPNRQILARGVPLFKQRQSFKKQRPICRTKKKSPRGIVTKHYYIRLSKVSFILVSLALGIAIRLIPNPLVAAVVGVAFTITQEECFSGKTLYRLQNPCERCLLKIALKDRSNKIPSHNKIKSLLCERSQRKCNFSHTKYDKFIVRLQTANIIQEQGNEHYLHW